MVDGLTTRKILLPLLILMSVISNQKIALAEEDNLAKLVSQSDSLDYNERKIEVLDISERSFDGGNAIAVTLSAPLNPELNHADYFSLTDNSGKKVDDSIVLSKNNQIVYFPFIEPSSDYKLTVYKGLTANNKSKLKKDAFQEIKTRPIVASYNFASKGSFLPLEQHNGLPVELVNIQDINVDYFKVPDDQVVQFLSNQGYFKNKIRRYAAQRSINKTELVYSARYQFNAPKNKFLNDPAKN